MQIPGSGISVLLPSRRFGYVFTTSVNIETRSGNTDDLDCFGHQQHRNIAMRASINSPVLPVGNAGYQAECQFSLEPSLVSLISAAENSGWNRSHVVMAIVALGAAMLETGKAYPVATGMDRVRRETIRQ